MTGLIKRQIRNGFFFLCLALTGACSSGSPIAASDSAAPQQAVMAAVSAPVQEQSPIASSKPALAARPASASEFSVKGVLAPDQPLEHGDYMWEDTGVPAGPITIVVDLKAQILYVYRGGMEIGRSAILYGATDKPTPTGMFQILEKDADHVSNLYGAPMPYMLRLTWDGIAIHGSTVEYGSATHGCVGIPDEFAQTLFRHARKGDRVLITNAWRTDVYGA